MDEIRAVLSSSLLSSSAAIDTLLSEEYGMDSDLKLKQAAVLILLVSTENCTLADFNSFQDLFHTYYDTNDLRSENTILHEKVRSNYFHDDIFILLTKLFIASDIEIFKSSFDSLLSLFTIS